MTVDEMLRSNGAQTADNGLAYAVVGSDGPGNVQIERMLAAVPKGIVQRLGRTACYFVPWLVKQRRGVGIASTPAEPEENRKELCHHLDIKPGSNLLLISLKFYAEDTYGLAMEFFDKVAYIASLERAPRDDFYELVERQLKAEKPGELTPEAWEWRGDVLEKRAHNEPDSEAEANYLRAAETDSLGIYMASLYTDVFYEDLFDDHDTFIPLPPELLYERIRALERQYPPNRGYSLQVVRQRARRRSVH